MYAANLVSSNLISSFNRELNKEIKACLDDGGEPKIRPMILDNTKNYAVIVEWHKRKD